MEAAASLPVRRFSAWYYVRTDDGAFSRVGLRRFAAFVFRECPLPIVVRSPTLAAHLMVIRRGRVPLQIWHAAFNRYALTPAGFYDTNAARAQAEDCEALRELLAPFPRHPEPLPPEARLIKRRIDTLYRWQPSAEDLEALEEVVNLGRAFR